MDMENTSLKTSANMAIIMGIFLPFAETVRSIHEILAMKGFFSWFDDYMLGAVLLLSAIRVKYEKQNAAAYLIAAWGVATGAIALSFWAHLHDYFHSERLTDRGVFSSGFVLIAKALILLFILQGLYYSIKANRLLIKK